ncbi:tetratricopeptide repeat protein [Congregibacter sp.]|uniref:tetratricopeptide repeat protein n=1 Tax=Congregibacter sp. TaxID=2744308 RepID=UPI003F6CCE4B
MKFIHRQDTSSRTAPVIGVLFLILNCLTPATGATDTAMSETDALASEEAAQEALMSDVRAYLQRIEAQESRDGAFAPGLTEDLLGLGLALQRNGDHEQAVKVFKRGIHLSRVNEGLYSRRQLALLEGEIASHIALGSLAAADERQRYLYRVQAKTLSDVTRGQALMEHALWQRQAYEAGIGEDPFARLVNMWSLYRFALSEFAKVEGDTSPLLLRPLYGMLQAQYMLSGFVGETTNGRYRTGGVYGDEESRQIGYRSQSYKQGNAVIQAIYDIQVAQDDVTLKDTAEVLLLLGDWQYWHGKRTEALDTYAQLYGELAETEAAQDLREQLFATPQPLPGLEGVRALPRHLGEQNGRLLLEFGVSERGRVMDVVRLDDHSHNDEKAGDIINRLRRTPFRPRIDDGLPVETQGLRWAYDTSAW